MKTTLNSSGIRIMNSLFKKKLLTAAMVTGAVLPLFAYGQPQHAGHAEHMPAAPKSSVPTEAAGMKHGTMGMTDMDHGSMSSMDHGSGEMDHGDMKMQGGSAPPDARDPDAYSDGFERNAGKYALPPSDALMMSDMHKFGSVYFDRMEYVKARGEEWAAY
ncbi:MAG TPA: hypothetical protein IAA18_08560, partial [Candidatus Pseudomonas excrementavium]|nr:hypothetical protein [Candidatus Pseudomonas excrementavium]